MWFYIDNHAPALPDRVPGPPKQCHEWFNHGYIQVEEDKLLQIIAVLKNKGVTGATIFFPGLEDRFNCCRSVVMLGSSTLVWKILLDFL